MWPEDFAAWWQLLSDDVALRTHARFVRYRLLSADARSPERVWSLAQQATQATYEHAAELQHFDGYFPNRNLFRLWSVEWAFSEGLRLLPDQPLVEPWLNQLPSGERQLLLWVYVDRLTEHQLARLLQEGATSTVTTLDARIAVRTAFRAFCDLLRANGWGYDDDRGTFPAPSLLVGLV